MLNHFSIRTLAILILLISEFMVFGCRRRDNEQGNSIQIKGSDTMVNLGQAWAEEFMKQHPGYSVAVTGGGSGTGISSLISNTCDIAEVSREMKDSEIRMAQERGVTPHKIVVALDGLAVVVNPSNPVSQLTIDRLADMFTGRITNWAEVGGRSARIVLLSREVNSGTHVYFKEHVLRKGDPQSKEEFAPQALLLSSSQAIADEVSQNPDAVGYYGMGYITVKEKPIKVAISEGSSYVSPNPENVVKGTYPISRPLLMYTKGEPSGTVKMFIDFVLSSEGQQQVRKLDFVPVTGR